MLGEAAGSRDIFGNGWFARDRYQCRYRILKDDGGRQDKRLIPYGSAALFGVRRCLVKVAKGGDGYGDRRLFFYIGSFGRCCPAASEWFQGGRGQRTGRDDGDGVPTPARGDGALCR